MSKLWNHYFVEGGDEHVCLICGGALQDVAGGSIGCEAGPEGNEPSYMGFAMTPFEYGLGYTSAEKAEHLMASVPEGGYDGASWSQAVAVNAGARPASRQRALRPLLVQEEHPVLAPGVPHRHQHEHPPQPRMERMRYPNNSLLNSGIERSRRRLPTR